MILQPGGQSQFLRETTAGAGSSSAEGSTKTDSILVTLFVDSVNSGSLNVQVVTLTDTGKEAEVISFPQITSGTTELLLKKSAVTLQRFRVTATYTGVCSYEVYVRAITGAGEASVRIVGPASLVTSSATVTTTPAALLASSLGDRQGVAIKNAGSSDIYVSEDISKLPTEAWIIGAGETWGLDIASGVTLYAVAASGSVNVRIAESGS